MIKNERILITGGGGFIGVALAERLVGDNEIILMDTNFDDNAFKFSSKLKKNKNVKLIKTSVLEYDKIKPVVKDSDIVVHLAAVLGVENVIENPRTVLDVNYIGTSNVLKASSDAGLKRFIFFSTSEVFGGDSFRVSEDGSCFLSSVQDARWCYSISKMAGEQLVLSYYRDEKLPSIIIRPFNIFGPRRIGDYVILRFSLNALKGKNLVVHGDGSQIRAWCYIDDIIDAVSASMDINSAVGHAFNIGNPLNTTTIYQLAKKIIRLCDSSSNIVFKDTGFADIDIRVPTISKAKDILNFKPKVELEEGLLKTLDWYKNHVREIAYE